MTAIETDLALLKRFTDAHDTAAFAEIVKRYAAMVFNACRRVVRDAALAEDVSQETFFRLMRRPESVTHSVGAWLHQAATNLAVDAVRSDSARKRREHVYSIDTTAERDDRDPPHRQVDSWAELSPMVDQALNELPADSRDLLVAHFLCGRAQNELAAEAGTSAATMCRRIKAAVEALQHRLRDRGLGVAMLALMNLLQDNALQAAPKALLAHLGKMTMVSGIRRWFSPRASVSSNPPIFWTAASVVGVSVTIGVLFTCLYARTLPTKWIPSPSARVVIDEQAPR